MKIAGAVLIAALLGSPTAPKRVVYGWFPSTQDPKANQDWSTDAIDWTALTHLSVRAVVLKADGSVDPGWGTTSDRIKKVVEKARKHGVKVTILAWGTNAAGSSSYFAHHQEKIVDGLLAFVKAHDLDGVNIDDETWQKTSTVDQSPHRERVTAFFRLLREKFKAARADYHLTWASPGVISSDDRFADAWPDYKAAAELLDGLTVMSYVMSSPTIGWTGASQPLGGGGKVGSHARDYKTLVQDYLTATGGRKDKLIFGLGNDRGGVEWDCHTDQPLSRIIGKPRMLTAAQARENAAKHGRKFDPNQKAPWYCAPKGDAFVQGWYEDDESLAAKLAYFREQDLAGVCIWVLDGVKEPRETFSLVRSHLLE
jgi:GH18 family chitinase